MWGVEVDQHNNGIQCVEVWVDGTNIGNQCTDRLKAAKMVLNSGGGYFSEHEISTIVGYARSDGSVCSGGFEPDPSR